DPEPLDPVYRLERLERLDRRERREPERFLFLRRESVRCGVGVSGTLVPPREYHVVRNALSDATSVTLHVYGGELVRCNVYLPEPDGRYRREERRLAYDEWSVW